MRRTLVSKIRRFVLLLLVVVVLSVAGLWIFVTSVSYKYSGPPSDHFDGSNFFNIDPGDHTFTDVVKWMWKMETVPWPEWVDDPVQPAPPESVKDGGLRVTYINHATVLIQMDGKNILTDPMWSQRAGPWGWFGPERVRAPGLEMDNLPAIDYVLISHDHYDHLDIPSLLEITEQHHPVILAGLGVRKLLEAKGIRDVREMDWWQTHGSEAGGVRFTFVPARHGSGRWPLVENRTLWGGFIIEGPGGDQIYFAGDTGYGTFLDAIRDRCSSIRLAILPIGNYEKRWFMKHQHMNPDDAVRVHRMLSAGQSMGLHYATFAEHPEQAIDAHELDLSEALTKYGIPSSQFWVLEFGEGRDVPGL